MAMNLVRAGVSAAVGASDAAVGARHLTFGTTAISWGAIVEVLALGGGAIWQLMAPHSGVNIADGLVDGGAALLAKRATAAVMARATAYAVPAVQIGGRAVPMAMAGDGARAQLGSATPLRRTRLV